MKILHIITSLARGGAEKLLVDFLPKYLLLGNDVTLVQLSSKGADVDYVDTLKEQGVKVITLSSGGFYTPSLVFKLKRAIQKNDCDIVHVHLFPTLYIAAILRNHFPSKKFVYTEHSNNNKRRKFPFLKPVERILYAKYDAIIAITENVSVSLLNWIGPCKSIAIINNGVDTTAIAEASVIDKNMLCVGLGINQDCHLLFMAASFRYPKDQASLVHLLSHLEESYHLLFAGEGGLKEDVEVLASELSLQNRVHFLGFRNDVKQLMKSVDVNILCSAYEGMSGVTLESLAADTPFLGSNVQGINDLVPDTRFLFENNNIPELASKIKEIINNPFYASALCETGASFVKKYDVQVMIEHHLSLYKRLLNTDVGRKEVP